MIQVKNIKKSFGDKTVLHDITSDFYPGKCNLIIGSSGSGKTVLMKLMIGLFYPDNGSILYNGEDMVTMDQERRKELRQEIGMLFQGSALFDSLTVEENVMFPLNMFTKDSYQKKLKRVNETLERVNLKDANKKFPAEISGGMMKRVGIARAIVLNPKYLFCDEPNSGLDPQTSMVIDHLIKELTVEYKTTTVINTHDMNSVMDMGDNILYMYQGHKEWTGNSEEIIYSDNERLDDFIFASDFLKAAKSMRRMQEAGEVPEEYQVEETKEETEKEDNAAATVENNTGDKELSNTRKNEQEQENNS